MYSRKDRKGGGLWSISTVILYSFLLRNKEIKDIDNMHAYSSFFY